MTMNQRNEELDDDISVEIESDGQETPASAQDDDDELGQYSTKVQSRINKLTAKSRAAERDKEEAQRLAEQLYQENQKLQQRVKGLDTGYLSEYGTRLEAQAIAAKDAFKKAYESGDPDALASAQEQMSKIAIDQERFRIAKQRSEAQPQQVERAEAPAPQAPRPQEVKVDKKAQTWAEKNDWFGSDKMLTAAAMALHSTLVEDEGFDPTSDEYYSEIDSRIRREFPHKFKTTQSAAPARVASAAASASKAAVQGRRSVKLSASQVAMAKRLNVPLEEYAKYVKE
jgi:FtsZ-binding cell division protein ZapB